MVLLNIENIPWQLTLTMNITDDDAMNVISRLEWYPEAKHYYGIVCENHGTSAMRYNYFQKVEEALAFIKWNLSPDTDTYFLLRQMTEAELASTLEKNKYDRLLQEGQVDN